MKKLILIFASTILIAACSGKEEPQVQQGFPPCIISGHDCWEVVRLTENTKIIPPAEEEIEKYKKEHNLPWLLVSMRAQLLHYENKELESLNLSVIKASAFFDGGSEAFTLSNGVTILRRWNTGIEREEPLGFSSNVITFPNDEVFVLNQTGKIIKHTPPPQTSQEN